MTFPKFVSATTFVFALSLLCCASPALFGRAATQPQPAAAAATATAGGAGATVKTGENANQEEESVNLSLRFMKWGQSNSISMPNMHTGMINRPKDLADEDVTLWFESGSEWKSIKFTSGSISSSISYSGPRKITFYTRSNEKGADGKYEYREACSMMLPMNVEEVFALVFKSGRSIRFYPMNVSPKSLPKEKVAVLNMTSHSVGLSVGESNSILKPGSYRIYTPKKKNKGIVDVKIYKFHEKKWRPVYDNTLTAPEDKRCLLLIYDPYNKRLPKFTIQMLAI